MGRHGRRRIAVPTSTSQGSSRDRRRLFSRAAGAMTSQVVTAGGSLVLQLVAAHTLGLARYGAFALCLSLLASATALYSGYVGDGLTVLDRRDPVLRQGLATSAAMLLLACAGLAITLVLTLHLGSVALSLIYALMVVLWLVEETGRRVLMARLQFWQLVVNDATYTLVTLAVVTIVAAAGYTLSLGTILAAMAIGALAAIVLARFQLPSVEYAVTRLGRAGLRPVVSFAAWRSLQVSLRPAQLLFARVILLQLVSLSAVGAVEAGRLVVAPIQTVINGAGGFLLSTSAEAGHGLPQSQRRIAQQATLLLVAVTVLAGCAAALLAHPLGRLVAGRPVPPVLVLGWTLYLATWAASLPFVTELVVRKLTRPVFVIRLADSLLGIAALAVGLTTGASHNLSPWLLSTGGVVSVVWTRQLAVRTRPAPTAAAPSPLPSTADERANLG